jgi:hypothetical protein
LKKTSSSVLKTFSSKAFIGGNLQDCSEKFDKGKTCTTFMSKSSSSVLKVKNNMLTKSGFNFLTCSEENNKTFFQKMTKANTISREKKAKIRNEHEFCIQNYLPVEKKLIFKIDPVHYKRDRSKNLRAIMSPKNDVLDHKLMTTISILHPKMSAPKTSFGKSSSSSTLLTNKPAIKGSKFLNNFSVLNYSQMEKHTTDRIANIWIDHMVPKQFDMMERDKSSKRSRLKEGELKIVTEKMNFFKKKAKVN